MVALSAQSWDDSLTSPRFTEASRVNADAIANDPHRQEGELKAQLEAMETDLNQMVECLQAEREHVATFEMLHLLEVVREKEMLLETMARRAESRKVWFLHNWEAMVGGGTELPPSLTEALRILAERHPDRFDGLEETASRLEALQDVAQELQDLNRSLVQRALTWIDAYMSELAGDHLSSLYRANGRHRRAIVGTSRGTI